MNQSSSNPWLGVKSVEVLFILLPPFFAFLSILLFKDYFVSNNNVSAIWWIILVVGIDVAHVYSTLFRTYFDKQSFNKNRELFIYTPLICLLSGILLYAIQPLVFWRLLAYLAVFHFMRQQYGFMRLYSRNEPKHTWIAKLDTLIIYAAVLYPILFWHTQADREFSWFVEGDFLIVYAPKIATALGYIYFILVSLWTGLTVYSFVAQGIWNTPKFLIITGTLISWYTGIVAFNGDLIFTCLNVVAHGIPYMALVWIYGYKQGMNQSLNKPNFFKLLFKPMGILVFISILIAFAYIEEGIWDAMVWGEHKQFFPTFHVLPLLNNPILLNLIVPLLSLPQITHYVLDAFIWKLKKPASMPELIK